MSEYTESKRGLVLVHTGEGRGKSTSAYGVILRMLGRRKKQPLFSSSSTRMAIGAKSAHSSGWDWNRSRPVTALPGPAKTSTRHKLGALHGWQKAGAIILSDDYELVVLDEFTYLMDFGWLDAIELIDWLQANKPVRLNLLITGRNAPQQLTDYADTVTEMRKVKHAYDSGILARAGIEF